MSSASSGLKVVAGTVGTVGEIAAGGLFEAAMSDRVSLMTAAAAMARGETAKRHSRSEAAGRLGFTVADWSADLSRGRAWSRFT